MPSYILKSYRYKGSPLELFDIFKGDTVPFLLYSGLNFDGLGRFSFMGSGPFLTFQSKGKHIRIQRENSTENLQENPLLKIKELLHQYRLNINLSDLPFTGGAVGYFSYDLGFMFENIPLKSKDDLNLPDCFLGLYHTILIFDHKTSQLHIFSCGLPEKDAGASQKLAESRLKEVLNRLSKFESNGIKNKLRRWENSRINLRPEWSVSMKRRFGIPKNNHTSYRIRDNQDLNLCNHISNFTKDEYIKAILKAKDYISRGDIYQLNLSQRFSAENTTEAIELYRGLSDISPAPFSAYMDFADFQIISSSPERFLNLNGGVVQTRPMKGTRPRSQSVKEDAALKKELLNSPKDKAELIMIVDLERNDLGKVCSYGSVKADQLRNLEAYSTVYQTTATVSGRLYPDKDCIDLLRACFPGGSITGCPKIRAMQIIEELEPHRRSIYTGSIGYLSFNGNIDLNIAIRTILKKQNKIYFQVGGGIVADSVPELEYQETLVKAKALFGALSLTHEPASIS